MKQEIKLPEIADNVVSGFLARILVKVGDMIVKDQSIIEIETDKAATDIPAPVGGKVVDIKVNAGDEVRVGQTIMVVESDAIHLTPDPSPALAPLMGEGREPLQNLNL